MTKITFYTTNLTEKQFTSAWTYLTDKNHLPCQGKIEIKDNEIICKSKEKHFALNLLFEAGKIGKIMMRTDIHSENASRIDLLESLIEGRRSQIVFELNKEGKMNKKFKNQLDKIEELEADSDKLEKLMLLGEELVINNSKEKLQQKINSSKTKDFMIGGQAFGVEKGEKYKNAHKNSFNLGIAPLYFFLLKPESRDKTNWQLTDKIVKWLSNTGRPIKGHPLIWLHKYARPEWMLDLSYTELMNFLEGHITEVVNRYKDDIKMWDIINEIPAEDANGFDLTINQLIEVTDMTSKLVKKLQPDAERIINFSEIFGAHSYEHEKPSVPPTYLLELLEKKGVEYESIGLQFYMGMKKEFTCRELMDISQTVDRFTEFDKDVHFSELGWPSKHDVDPYCFFTADHPEVAGRWHRDWDEELQAEFLEKIYALFASKPNARSITWWDLTDNGHHEDIGSRFIPFAGLTRRDFSEKPALKSLKKFKRTIK
jgi:endo-1,4-beta-xylanase